MGRAPPTRKCRWMFRLLRARLDRRQRLFEVWTKSLGSVTSWETKVLRILNLTRGKLTIWMAACHSPGLSIACNLVPVISSLSSSCLFPSTHCILFLRRVTQPSSQLQLLAASTIAWHEKPSFLPHLTILYQYISLLRTLIPSRKRNLDAIY